MKLRLRLLLLIALTVSSALAASFWLIGSAVRRQTLADLDRSLHVAQTVWKALSMGRAQGLVASARALAAEPGFVTVLRGTDRATLLDYLREARENNASLDVIVVMRPDGAVLVSTAAVRPGPGDPLVLAGLEGGAGAAYWDAGGGEVYLAGVAPIRRQGNVVEGVLILGQRLDRQFVTTLSGDTGTDVALLPVHGAPYSTLADPTALVAANRGVRWSPEVFTRAVTYGDTRALLAPLCDYAGSPVASLAMVRDSRAALAYFSDVTRQLLLLGLATLAGASLVSLPLVRRMTESVLQLERAQAEMDAVFQANLDGLVALNQAGRVVSANPAAAVCFGQEVEQLRGQSLQDLLPAAVFAELLGAQPGAGQVVQRSHWLREGRTFDLTRTFVASRHLEVGSVLVTRDVTDVQDRTQGQDRLWCRLAACLRQGVQAADAVGRLRFEKHLENLLVLSGAGPADEPPIRNLATLLIAQVEELRPLQPGVRVAVEEPVPSVEMRPCQLRLVLLNLLDQAQGPGQEVTVRLHSPGGGCWLTVSGLEWVAQHADTSREALEVVLESCSGRIECDSDEVRVWLPARC